MNTARLGPESSESHAPRIARPRARRVARLILAAAVGCPALAVIPAVLRADDPAPGNTSSLPLVGEQITAAPAADQPIFASFTGMQPANEELLKRGADELNNRQYEEALATLQQVNTEGWKDEEKKVLLDMLAKAETGANERRAARAAFEKGEAALAAQNYGEAVAQYRAAAENRYADDGTRAKSREQIAVAENLAKGQSTDLKSVFASAKEDYKAGRYVEAKAKFEQLQASRYRTGLFEKSVNDWLKDANEKVNAGFTGTAVAKPPQPTAEQQKAVEDATAKAQQQYEAAQARESAEERQRVARESYKLGREQYRRGDWISARENLNKARDMQYRPGLFEDSPEKLLARMDAKEQADAALAAREAQARAEREAADKARMEAEAQAKAQAETEAAERAKREAEATAAANEKARQDAEAAEKARQAAEATAAAEKARQEAEAAKATPPVAQTTPPSNPPVTTAPPAETTTPPMAQVTPAEQGAPTAMQELQKTAELEKVQGEQNAFKARELVQQADAARAANRLDEALTLYSQAAALDPNNTQAAEGRTALTQLTGRVEQPSDLLTRQAQLVETRRQAINYEFDNAIARAREAINARNFKDAAAALSQARIARNQDPTIFRSEELNKFDTVLAETQLSNDQTAAAAERDAREAAIATARQAEVERAENEAAQRRSTVASLTSTARELTMQRKYKEASAVVDQILVIDPNNDYAIGVKPLLEDKRQLRKQAEYRELFDRQMAETLIESEEKRIPYTDILRYPENWPELSEIREQTVEKERGGSGEDQSVTQQLEAKLPEINLNQVPFSDVIDFLRDVSKANIFVNWRALENAGIAKDAPVSARLRDVKFRKVLDAILADVGGGTIRLNYTIDEGVITISTEDELARNVVTRVYDIRDLIINIPDFTNAPDFNLQQSSGGGRGGGGGQQLFSGSGGGNEEDEGPTRAELVDEIIRLVQDTIATDSWKDNGGSVGSIRELQGQLIVTQTPENQRQLVRLLEQLRETRAIQVTIEARFLSVQRNFLEDIGLDFDFAFANLDDRIFDTTPTPQFPGDPAAGIPPGSQAPGVVSVQQNSSLFTNPLNLNTNLPGNLASAISDGSNLFPSLTSGITFLDDFQVRAILRATQVSATTNTITAPRVTLFNGQRAYVLISTQRAYVSDLTPVVGTGAVGFDPQTAYVNTGAVLDVQATVSSDRKYVTLTLRPQVATLLNLRNFQVAQATAGGGTVGGGTTTSGVATAFVQQPEVQITDVRTTVSVPDGGTLLLGGQTLAAEIEREGGVPVLSKIPFLKRLFTNRSMAKDDQVLLILVKPTIIIQREQEQKQFPLLSTKANGG